MPEIPAVPRAGELEEAVERAFARDGPLARTLQAFEPRDSQREMAAAVAATLDRGGVLLAEAGTGTGKTLAYLIPAILSRQRILVSTGTKHLQEQIFFKDLPLLRQAIGVPFTATYMKGRANYLCLHRFDALRENRELRGADDQACLALIESWAPHTELGDRAELEDLPEDLPLWHEIAATSENCLGTECPRYQECFITRMRQRAAESDVVIVNHHLLCADAAVRHSAYGEVIPNCTNVIIDEAHQLEDVATQYFGLTVSNYRLDELVRDGERALGARQVTDDTQATALASGLTGIRDAIRWFVTELSLLASRTGLADGRDVRVTAPALAAAAEPGQRLVNLLQDFAASIALVPDTPEDVRALGRRATELEQALAFLLKASDPDYVYHLESRRRGVFLHASPIDVSATVRQLLLDRMHATVLTSATLAVAGSFEYIRRRLGIRSAHELSVASDFDFSRQALLYLPHRMPDPRSPAFGAAATREIIEILRRTAGRAFVLFTSYSVLKEVETAMRPALGYPILVQGTAPRSALLHEFRATPHAVLLATASFWQGVDVAGAALSCVIIDKLPFASPSDPITAARMEAIAGGGGEPFGEYQVPMAVLTLLQGLGRLIRHRHDRGILAVLDPRLRTKGYGRRFLEALPPAPVTGDLGAIERFLSADPASAQTNLGE